MRRVKVEVWNSSENQEEIHVFLAGEPDEYIIGFNPRYITPSDIIRLLEKEGYEINDCETGQIQYGITDREKNL